MKKILFMACIFSVTMLVTSCSKDGSQIPSSKVAVTLDQEEKLDEKESISKASSLTIYTSPNEEYTIAFPGEWVKDNEPVFDVDNNLSLSMAEGAVDISVNISDLPSEEIEETLEWYKEKGEMGDYITGQGYTVSVFQYADHDSFDFYGIVCKNEKMYRFYCSATPEFYKENEGQLIEIVQSLTILSSSGHEANEVKQTGGTEDYGDEYEVVDREILEKYRAIEESAQEIKVIDLKRMENEIINLQLYEIMDMTEESMYILQESPLSVSKMILYGLTTQPAVLEATVYDKEGKLSALEEYIPEFQGLIAKNYDNFKLSMHSANDYTNEYFVYVNLDQEDCDMQVLIEFKEIHGKYYFERFKSI